MWIAAERTRSSHRNFVGVAQQSDAGVQLNNMLDAEEVQQCSYHKAMLVCSRAACSTRLEWSSFSYVNVNVLLRVS